MAFERANVNTDTAAIQRIFGAFRSELDEHHDRRERVIKASRDITALSKKIIFSLHRVRSLNKPLPKNVSKDNHDRFALIKKLFTFILPDLAGINAYRYQWQTSPGIQEYIEAVTFQHYIETQQLMSQKDVISSLPHGILVTAADYILGVFDLTGEMMRFAITSMAAGSNVNMSVDGPGEQNHELDKCVGSILIHMQQLRVMLESINVPLGYSLNRDFWKKLEVMQNSVEKVEREAYGLIVRSSERSGVLMPDVFGAD
ncbi:hypothetical protein ACO22_07719 [Paracoccidioides brasiliensis]|uniref:Uncharacterized protein n=1 Tax=Paracoccidioides brasiliensis TaxID=121759 RepID=A0A1D2J3Z2_PARBR|nr:hypothetical protein ACO22_07719 [Paracoccidioides brasiliensis]ODH49222.1 hypothetical protein GX48_04653 [Paracoccidioides brasiliensis]